MQRVRVRVETMGSGAVHMWSLWFMLRFLIPGFSLHCCRCGTPFLPVRVLPLVSGLDMTMWAVGPGQKSLDIRADAAILTSKNRSL